mgnify:CR=1 FL=1
MKIETLIELIYCNNENISDDHLVDWQSIT